MYPDNESQHLGLVDEVEDTPVRGLGTDTPFSETSIIEQLQAEAQEIAGAKEVDIPIKGYQGTGLRVRYHLPDRGKELSDIADKVRREMKDAYSRNLTIAIDTMIHLCSGLYVQPDGVPEPVMLDPGDTGIPVTYDQRLAEILGMENSANAGARAVVRRVFGNNDMAIIAHAEKLNRWFQNTKTDVSLEVWQLGE